MHAKPLIGLMALTALGLAACGSNGTYGTKAAPTATTVGASASTAPAYAAPAYAAPASTAPAPTASTPDPTPTTTPTVTLADSPLGKIFVDSEGHTLYAFTKDANGVSTCTGACAMAWPAAMITGDPVAGAGITAALKAIDSPAGGKMIEAGKWPLYRFAGDAAAGDINGEGSGGVWFAVRADGTLVKS